MSKSRTIQVTVDEDICKRYLKSVKDSTVEEDIKSFVTSALAGSICDHENIYGFDVDDSQVEIKFL